MSYSKLLEPITVGTHTFRNRMVMAPMETRLATITGDVTQQMCDYYAARARGGVAAVIVENTFVDNIASRSSISSNGFYSDHLIAGKYRLAEAIRLGGAKAILQLSHGGRQASPVAVPGQDALAPSPIPCKFVGRMPRALTVEEIVGIEDAFAQAARRAKQAGFDGVEIHGAHGYLICSFLSPYTNHRTDEYGGSPENRARFAINIIRKIREQVGDDYLLGIRISGSEFVEGGLTAEDTCSFGRMIEDMVDYIHVSGGIYETMATHLITPLYRPHASLVPLAAAMKKTVTKCRVIAVNALTPVLAEQALERGDADIIAFGRPLIADPELPLKLEQGRAEDIRPCMRGHEGCVSLFFTGCPMRCEVNPQAGRERDYVVRKTDVPRKVLVVGGGMAGMEAARVAALYGHDVTLLEKTDTLGGHFVEAAIPEFKSDSRDVLNWEIRQIEKSPVKVMLETEATPERIRSVKPDVLIVAVGSEYITPPIPGMELTVNAREALRNPASVGERVVVIGGGLVGSETALYLAQQKKHVAIVEMQEGIVLQDEPLSRIALLGELDRFKVDVHVKCRVLRIEKNKVTAVGEDGKEVEFPCDSVVAALGLASRKACVAELSGLCGTTIVIGDAKKSRKIFNCMHEAWNAVRSIS